MTIFPKINTAHKDKNKPFKIVSEFVPTGDQPIAIAKLVEGINTGQKAQVLLGATGTGKTFTIANVIEHVQKPTLVIAHNKTLAAQLACEFKEFFPNNAIEYFVSYYDYYQPEAYVAHSDTYIEKDASINNEIDKMRHSATSSLFERHDVIIVASVSCIYGLGSPETYSALVLSLRQGQIKDRKSIINKLVEIQYIRNDSNLERGKFRVRGDVIEVFPVGYNENAIRIKLFDSEIDCIMEFNTITGEIIANRRHVAIYPASHYASSRQSILTAINDINCELTSHLKYLKTSGKLLEAQRLEQRTRFDIEMMLEMGYCSGIENYSRYLTGRKKGDSPCTLIDYFPDDFLIVVDESHVTLPQIRAMYAGDKSRKDKLIEHGFRLPSAYDNRPLTFSEFIERINQIIYISATPGNYEIEFSEQIIEQIIRPTGLIDPEVEIKPISGQIDDLITEIKKCIINNERVLITTLTKKMAEELTEYLKEIGIKVDYIHSDIATLERTEIIRNLRIGKFDVLVGINLLREGLDLPEVSLVAILDADKEGFLRSETALIQTIGRAARNLNGKVIMYADRITTSMKNAIDETNRRKKIQCKYNTTYGIIPKSISKKIKDLETTKILIHSKNSINNTNSHYDKLNKNDILDLISNLKKEMRTASKMLNFERAAELRDIINELKKRLTT